MQKVRVDHLLVERGLVESRSQAQRIIMAGKVRVDGQIIPKPAIQVSNEAQIEVEKGPRFVSRGGEKLDAAILAFGIDVREKICVDVGASTGGFTDCLLQHGASKVFAVDVGKGVLHWKLRQDRRVVVLEKTNARHLKKIPERPEIVTVDVSFISLKVLLDVIRNWFENAEGEVIALIKPQFEAGKEKVDRAKGVIRDPLIHAAVLRDILTFAQKMGYQIGGLIRSPLAGPKGNIEFLTHLLYPKAGETDVNLFIAKIGLITQNDDEP